MTVRRSLRQTADIAKAASACLGSAMSMLVFGCSPLATPDYIAPQSERPAAVVSTPKERQKPLARRLAGAIDSATQYLCESVSANGRFAYLRPPRTGDTKNRYNMLRHAGTLYALATAHRARTEPCIEQTATKAGDFLRRHLFPIPGWPETLAVFRNPKLRSKSKLGGAGLALVAAASWQERGVQLIPLGEQRKLGRFILKMQRADGSFYSRWLAADGRPDPGWTSLYYPGEAALGLLLLYQHDPDPRWFKAATSALLFLARRRRGSAHVPADHWALLATERCLQVHAADSSLKESELLLLRSHAQQVVATMLAEGAANAAPTSALHHGSFDSSGRTTPTATRLEGLQAAQQILGAKHRLQPAMEQTIRRGIDFLIRMQISEGPRRGGMPRSLSRDQKNQRANKRANEVRIDYVQHALSAWLQRESRLQHPVPAASSATKAPTTP